MIKKILRKIRAKMAKIDHLSDLFTPVIARHEHFAICKHVFKSLKKAFLCGKGLTFKDKTTI